MNRDEAVRLLALAREAEWAFPSSSGRPVPAEPGERVTRLEAEREAFVEAAACLDQEGNHDAAVELAADIWRLWVLAGDDEGGRAFLAALLDDGAVTPSLGRALALYGDGLLAFRQGAIEESRQRNEAALETALAVGSPEAEALALLGLSRVAISEGGSEQARALAARSRALLDGLDPALGQAPLHMLAQATRSIGDHDEAAALFTESLALNRRLGDRGMIVVELHNLGHVEMHRGNVDAAERYFEECAELGGAGDPYDQAMVLLNRAVVAFARGNTTGAAGLLRRAESMLSEAGEAPAADDVAEMDRLRRQLDDASGSNGD